MPASSASTSGSSPADLLLLSLSPLASLLCFSPHSFASLGVATSGFQCPTNKKIIWDQRLALHLHPIENQVVGLAKTLEEVINLLPLDTSIVVIALTEPKVNLREKENLSLHRHIIICVFKCDVVTLEFPWLHLLMSYR